MIYPFKTELKDAFLTLLMLVCIYFLTSCKTRYIEVPPSVKTEYINRMRIDTFIQNDSVIIRDRGDTVYLERIKREYLIRNRIDTIIQRDSISVVVPVEKVVYKKTPFKEKMGSILIGIYISIGIWILRKLVVRF